MQTELINQLKIPSITQYGLNKRRLTLTQYNTRVILQICHKINDNFKKQISMADLVEEFKLSESVLTKRFKFVYKQTIYQYRVQRVMQYAAERMGHGASPKYLTKELGYSNYRSFARAFKSVFGGLPKKVKQ